MDNEWFWTIFGTKDPKTQSMFFCINYMGQMLFGQVIISAHFSSTVAKMCKRLIYDYAITDKGLLMIM